MEAAILFLTAVVIAFLLGKYFQNDTQTQEKRFIETVQSGMEYDLKQVEHLPDKLEQLRASEVYRYEYVREFGASYQLKSISRQSKLERSVIAEAVLLGRFLGRSDDESVELVRKRVQEYKAQNGKAATCTT